MRELGVEAGRVAQHTVASVTVIHAPTSVLSRIATIQAHLRLSTADTDASMTPAAVAGFDPFGAAYQAALDQAPVGGSNDPPAVVLVKMIVRKSPETENEAVPETELPVSALVPDPLKIIEVSVTTA